MLTHKFTIRKERNNAVMLRLTAMRKSSELALGISLAPECLAEILNGEIPQGYKEQAMVIKHYQNVITDLKDKLTDKEIKTISASDFQKCIREEIEGRRNLGAASKKGDIAPVFLEKIKSITNRNTKSSYVTTMVSMKEFCKDPDNGFTKDFYQLMFEDINNKWLTHFDLWLKNKKNLKPNTRWIYIMKLRAVANKALDDEIIVRDPFRRFKIRKEDTRKRSLTIEDLREVFNFTTTIALQYHIDVFKLMFMLIGINTKDLYNLKSITRNGRVEYRRAKTGTLYSIKVEPEAMELINKLKGEKNLISLADRSKESERYTVLFNKMLKRIGTLIDSKLIEEGKKSEKEESDLSQLSAYWARHTWATIAAELDIPDATISLALGHKSATNQTTAVYIKRNLKKIDEANRRVLDYVFYNKR